MVDFVNDGYRNCLVKEDKNMEKLRNGRWNHQMATAKEFAETLKELRAKSEKYGWGNEKVAPYGFWISVDAFINNPNYDDFESFNSTSKSIMIDELNGFIDIANIWEAKANEPKVKIKTIKGKIIEVPKSTADDFIEMEFAVLV